MDGFDYILTGAEKQAATSAALAYPEKQFLFVTNQPVIDGWDLPNVKMRHAEVGTLFDIDKTIALKQAWCSSAQPLKNSLDVLAADMGAAVLPVLDAPDTTWESWIVKGDNDHKPDGVITGSTVDTELPTDDYGYGYVFQEHKAGVKRNMFVTGRVTGGGLSLGTFLVYSESIAREDLLVAVESIEDKAVEVLAKHALDLLNVDGFFTFNLIENDEGIFITSFRPTPKPVFATMRKGGIDLLNGDAGTLGAGYKFIGDIHYSSYQTLGV